MREEEEREEEREEGAPHRIASTNQHAPNTDMARIQHGHSHSTVTVTARPQSRHSHVTVTVTNQHGTPTECSTKKTTACLRGVGLFTQSQHGHPVTARPQSPSYSTITARHAGRVGTVSYR